MKKNNKSPLSGGYCFSIRNRGPFVIGRDFDPPVRRRPLPQGEIRVETMEQLWSMVAPDQTIFAKLAKRREFENGVNSAVRWYLSDCEFHANIPQFRKQLEKLRKTATCFESELPDETTALGHFLFMTYTGEVMLRLVPPVDDALELEHFWHARVGMKALEQTVQTMRRNIEGAQSLVGKTKPRKVRVVALVRNLARVWTNATGEWPTSGRHPLRGTQTGRFASFVHKINVSLPRPYRIAKLDADIRKAIDPKG
jgi:hypothetical protein